MDKHYLKGNFTTIGFQLIKVKCCINKESKLFLSANCVSLWILSFYLYGRKWWLKWSFQLISCLIKWLKWHVFIDISFNIFLLNNNRVETILFRPLIDSQPGLFDHLLINVMWRQIQIPLAPLGAILSNRTARYTDTRASRPSSASRQSRRHSNRKHKHMREALQPLRRDHLFAIWFDSEWGTQKQQLPEPKVSTLTSAR